MTSGAGDRGDLPRRRRPGRAATTAAALLLLLGGGGAVAYGLLGQDADPPAPAVATVAEQSPTAAPPPAAPVPSAPPPAEPAPAVQVAAPAALRIPAIEVQSPLIRVGLDATGALVVPQPGPDYDKAAWYEGSPRPGAVGPAVIEGHVDSAANGPSVFYRLGELVAGDRVEVDREDGTTAVFAVTEVRVVPKDDFPTLDVYGNTEGPQLRLITCGGPFDSSAGSYADNTVVFASEVTAP